MSNLTPVLRYDFTELTNNAQISDLSGNNYTGTLDPATNCSLVTDPVFGTCLQFGTAAGKGISFPALANFEATEGFTYTAWVNYATIEQFICILNLYNSDASNWLSIQSTQDTKGGLYFASTGADGQQGFDMDTPIFKTNEWVHVAVVIDPQLGGSIYINGKLVASYASLNNSLIPAAFNTFSNNLIGGSLWPEQTVPTFTGLMAWVSIYNSSLSAAEVITDMNTRTFKMPQAVVQYNYQSLTGAQNNTLTDLSGNGYDASVNLQNGALYQDPQFGKCLQFNGNELSAATINIPQTAPVNFAAGMTFCAWMNFETFTQYTSLLSFGESGNQNGFVVQNLDTNGGLSFCNYNVHPSASSTNSPILTLNEWMHIAVTVGTDGTVTMYQNGKVFGTPTTNSNDIPSADVIASGNTYNIGSSPFWTYPSFQGKMAWSSVYNAELNLAQVNADLDVGMQQGKAAFRAVNPIGFELGSVYNNQYKPVLYIQTNNASNNLNLNISNQSGSSLNIPTGTGTASASNYHFQLRFRPGILSQSFINQLLTITNWSVVIVTDQNGTVAINFLNIGTATSLVTGQNINLVLDGVSADPTGGARNTNVELMYGAITLGESSSPVSGSRIQSLSLVNHTGQKNIPLALEINGSDRVLNDGKTENTIRFQIRNLSNNPLAISADTANPTKFELQVPISPSKGSNPDALVNFGDISQAGLSVPWDYCGVVMAAPSGCYKIDVNPPFPDNVPIGTSIDVYNADIPPGFGGGADAIFTLWTAANQGDTSIIVQSSQEFTNGGTITPGIWSFYNSSIYLSGSVTQLAFIEVKNPLKQTISRGTSLTFFPAASSANPTLLYDAPAGTTKIVLSSATSIQLGAKFKLTSTDVWQPKVGNSGNNPNVWEKTFTCIEAGSIDAYTGLLFAINQLICGCANGVSYITLNYYNVPGYWDGSMRIPVNKEPIYIEGSSVGIGTAPRANTELAVNGNVDVLGSLQLEYNNSNGSLAIGEITAPGRTAALAIDIGSNNTSIPFAISSANGNTLYAMASIETGQSSSNFAYLINVAIGSDPASWSSTPQLSVNSGTNVTTSIAVNGIVSGASFQNTSDARIKNEIGLSDVQEDVQRLMQLQVKDYGYKDSSEAESSSKGLIAQELEQVMPEAVSLQSGFIPHLQVFAAVAATDVEHVYLLSLERPHECHSNDQVRYLHNDEYKVIAVEEVISETEFLVKSETPLPDKLFLYGKAVHDLRAVDYHMVSMMGISALQQTRKELEQVKEESQHLKSEMTQLREELAQLKEIVLNNGQSDQGHE